MIFISVFVGYTLEIKRYSGLQISYSSLPQQKYRKFVFRSIKTFVETHIDTFYTQCIILQ